MQKKENTRSLWKTAAWCALCGLGIYLGLQFLGALLVAQEKVEEGQVGLFVALSAGAASAAGVLVMGRGCRSGRLFLGLGCAGGLGAVMFLGALLAGEATRETWMRLATTIASAAAGGILGAVAAAGKKGKKKSRRR